MIYFQIQTNTGKIIAGNMHEFSRHSEFENSKNFSEHKNGKGIKSIQESIEDASIWLVVENEADLLKSNKLFQKTLNIYRKVALDLWKYEKTQLEAHTHTLTTIQGQIRQKIEGFASDTEFYEDTYADLITKVVNLIKSNVESAADLICYVQKRIVDMRAHLLGVEIIHTGTRYEIKPLRVSLKRAILSQCSPFLEELEKNLVKVRFFFDEEHEVEVDKNMFSLVVYNFFSNALKYTKPNSEIRLNYLNDQKILDISMISLKMEKDEIKNLSNETVRGRHAKNIPGKGIGLFVLQRALELMGKEKMYIVPDYEKVFPEDGKIYNENHFKFSL